ncbi:MAG TPA: 1,4-dihydroxy-2-naphthoate polyprenyltransferase [Thermoanaerobaculia bacterium]|jgi:1,4-dihydroxy-2-naphthoate octaprenyltransferase|nr:1,4-dihydroxy-2-naphthoate polyprenyltransferase [Thermoanaerobaculia bacterium]
MKNWFLAARPKTLAASVTPVLVGTALAFRDLATMHWQPFLFALLGAVFIQIGTNYVNDALDFKKGADTHTRLGPLRVTAAGLLSAEAVLRGAYVCFFLAALCGIPLILRGGWPIAAIGIASIAAAYAYTGGPYPLAYHGLGEVFVMIFFGLVAVCGSFYLQRLTLDPTAWIGGFAVGSLAVVILGINNLRDIDNDRASNKRTLAARFGAVFAHAEIVIFALTPFLCAATVAYLRGSRNLAIPMLALIPALALLLRVARSHGAELNRCLALAGALEWIFGILYVVGAALG